MESLIANLGLDWKLLLSQAVNFLILLTVLRFALYKPLINMMRARRERIEEGLTKAEEADRRLEEISHLQKEKTQEAEAKGLEIVAAAAKTAKQEEQHILAGARVKEEQILLQAKEKAEAQEKEAFAKVQREAAGLVKEILVKVVSLSPEAVDDALIQKAATATGKHPSK